MMRRSRSLQRGLVIAEVALVDRPLVLAGLMLRTFANLTHAPLGFEPSNVVTPECRSASGTSPGMSSSGRFINARSHASVRFPASRP